VHIFFTEFGADENSKLNLIKNSCLFWDEMSRERENLMKIFLFCVCTA
jgi:hypothetical protein